MPYPASIGPAQLDGSVRRPIQRCVHGAERAPVMRGIQRWPQEGLDQTLRIGVRGNEFGKTGPTFHAGVPLGVFDAVRDLAAVVGGDRRRARTQLPGRARHRLWSRSSRRPRWSGCRPLPPAFGPGFRWPVRCWTRPPTGTGPPATPRSPARIRAGRRSSARSPGRRNSFRRSAPRGNRCCRSPAGRRICWNRPPAPTIRGSSRNYGTPRPPAERSPPGSSRAGNAVGPTGSASGPPHRRPLRRGSAPPDRPFAGRSAAIPACGWPACPGPGSTTGGLGRHAAGTSAGNRARWPRTGSATVARVSAR